MPNDVRSRCALALLSVVLTQVCAAERASDQQAARPAEPPPSTASQPGELPPPPPSGGTSEDGESAGEVVSAVDTPAEEPVASATAPGSQLAGEDEAAARETSPPEQGSPVAAAPKPKPPPATGPSRQTDALQPASAGATASPASQASYTGPDACRTQQFNYAALRNACQQGGVAQAKRVMKQVVSRAKAAGTALRCSGCHSSLQTYALKPNAVADLKPWL